MFVNLLVLFVVVLVGAYEECGIVPPNTERLPWLVGIYMRDPLMMQCSGNLVSDTVIITDAHSIAYLRIPPSEPNLIFAVAGNFTRNWVEPTNDFIQRSSVKEIHIAPGFTSRRTMFLAYYANDLAVLVVENSFRFNEFIRPVCLDFDYAFEQTHLQSGNKATGIGWIQTEFSPMNAVTARKYLSYVLHVDCLGCDEDNITNPHFKNKLLITALASDKICFKADEGTIPPGQIYDSGFGVVFPTAVNGTQRYYLRGVFSDKKDFGLPCEAGEKIQRTIYYEFSSIRKHESLIRRVWNESWSINNQGQAGRCRLPPFPASGSYTTNITHPPSLDGDSSSVLVELTVSCRRGYGVRGKAVISCYNGFWPDKMPVCVRMCTLKAHPSVEYRCLVTGDVVGSRECGAQEAVDTIVSPACRKPHFYAPATLPFMRCQLDGDWDYVARCQPECGTVTTKGMGLAVGGAPAERGEVPWHAGIYMKSFSPYKQVCGGSLISNRIIISAAHCFWTDTEMQLPASMFAVAVGKLYRPWSDKVDDSNITEGSQKSDVKSINIPPRFQGAFSNFQDDIAVVITSQVFQYRSYVRPVCLSFEPNFDSLQLQTGNKGLVAGWGLTEADGTKESPKLLVVELPYVQVGTCIKNSPAAFTAHITSDKICAGERNSNIALCRGDSGGGLSFPAPERETPRHYLRGVVSAAPDDGRACNVRDYTAFTHLLKHEDFIKRFWTEN